MTTDSKVALVTGASFGIGAAITRALMADGFIVLGLARSWGESEALPQHQIVCDVSDNAAIEKVFKQYVAPLDRLDLLVNNAGIFTAGTLDVSAQDFEKYLRINSVAPLMFVRAALPYLKRSTAAYVINISSLCGKVGFAGIGAYCSSKFALNGLSESLFRELVPQGIRVTSICPSYVATRVTANSGLPQAKMISTQDIATTVRYLLALSPQAAIKEVVVECASDLP